MIIWEQAEWARVLNGKMIPEADARRVVAYARAQGWLLPEAPCWFTAGQIRKNRFPTKSPVIGVKLTGSTTRSNRHVWRSALVSWGAVRAITCASSARAWAPSGLLGLIPCWKICRINSLSLWSRSSVTLDNPGRPLQNFVDWLKEFGMSEYTERYAENHIDFSALPDLTETSAEGLRPRLYDGCCRNMRERSNAFD
jgi:SAM domain (Sterile alpha motif)